MVVHLATLHVVLATHQRTDVYMLPAANGGKKKRISNKLNIQKSNKCS
jgi:hypothetical protein